MQKFCFQYQFEGKGLGNNSGSSVNFKMAAKIQDGCQFPSFFALRLIITFVLLNTEGWF